MAELSNVSLVALAKRQLGLRASTSDLRVPDFYLEELRSHLKLYPLEDNFRVTLQPKIGFGTVTCLKNGCGEVTALTQRAKCDGGGKSDGFGSLSAYRIHLASHLLQETRVRTRRSEYASLNAQPSSSIKTENLPPSFQPSRPLTRTASLSRPKDKETSKTNVPRVKPEPVESIIPRKRHSDTAFTGIKGEKLDKEPVVDNPSKKVKTQTTPKSPLAQVTNVPSTTGTTSELAPMYSGNHLGRDVRAKPEDAHAAIGGQLHTLQRPYAMPGPRDMYPHNLIRDDIAHLQMHETAYRRDIPAPTPNYNPRVTVQKQPVVKSEYRDFQFVHVKPPLNTDVPQRKPRAVPRAFPMDLDEVEHKPLNNSHYATSSSSPAPQNYAHVASSSSTPPTSDDNIYYPAERDVKPFALLASSSRAVPHPRLSYPKTRFPGKFVDISDDESQDSEDSEPIDLPNLDRFAERVGINIPPPIGDDAHDDNGDYHGRGHDLFVGPQAASDDIEKFLVEAGNAENFDGNETVDKALAYLGLKHLDEKLPGMEISLMAHQVMGVAWMLEKEKTGIQGGCLADEMGLGKTVQMIACMIKNRSTDPACKTNLIIAPLALLNQWKLEIEEKTNCGLTCLVYHGQSRTRRKSDLLKYDVVLTTFNTMAMEWPDYENEMKKKAKAKKSKRKEDSFIVEDSDEEDMRNAHYRADKRKQHVGLLFQISFHRIVADEGQQIRNRRTRMSRAITDLQAKFRWVLTGTPIVNSLSDVYGYIRFLKIRPWYDWTEFHREIGKLEKKRPGVAVARLQKVMTAFLLRRKKDSKLDGKNLIELPPKEVLLLKLEFSPEEREIYSMIEARSQAKFNRYLRAGTVLKNYHQVLVLLLRLRQICSHPSLIQENGVAFVHPDEAHVKPEFATELTRARRLVSAEFVDKMKQKFKQEAMARMEAEKQSANATVEEEECPICYDAMTDAVITPCAHIFCRDCIVDVLNRAPPMDPADQVPGASADERPCPVCRSAISSGKLFSREAFETSDEVLNNNGPADTDDEVDGMDVSDDPVSTSKRKRKGKVSKRSKKTTRTSRRNFAESDDDDYDSEDDEDDSDMSDFIVESDEDEEEKDARRAMKKRQVKRNAHVILDSDDEPDTPEEQEVIFGLQKKAPMTTDVVPTMSRFLPSSKMKYMMEQLKKLKQSNPEEKTLVVSQWTGCLSLVSDYLTENGIPHVKYQGDMNRPKRDQAVQVFMAKEKARVMLMSLKCGGVGLNLTRANNVISLDLGWSQAVEAQAYDRVHRLGQTRKVTVQRVVIADTVEDRILALQDRKQALADGSLGEGTGQKIGKLSVKELANLFGLDARGRRLTA